MAHKTEIGKDILEMLMFSLYPEAETIYREYLQNATDAIREACDAGRVLVNGKAARASYDVKIGDTLEIQLGNRRIVAEVLKISEYANRETASELFRLISEEKIVQSFPEDQESEE